MAGATWSGGDIVISEGALIENDLGDTFEIMTFNDLNGRFAVVNGLDVGNGKEFAVDYNGGSVTLEVVAN